MGLRWLCSFVHSGAGWVLPSAREAVGMVKKADRTAVSIHFIHTCIAMAAAAEMETDSLDRTGKQ